MEESILSEQVAYYRARASEYDQWHLREGRYDRGEEHKQRWFRELDTVRFALEGEQPFGACLELACGTGLWTNRLAAGADSLTAIDVVPETIEINRTKFQGETIRFEVADLFEWQPTQLYDFVFFGFWLSHVPLNRFDKFWYMVRDALKPGGKAFFVDNLQTQDSTAINHTPIDDSGVVQRKLNDGTIFNIVKIFYNLGHLKTKLEGIGFQGHILKTGQFFYYGSMKKAEIGQQPHATDADKRRR